MATKRPDRVWIGSGVAASLVVAAAGWLFLISPQLDAKAEAEQQFADAQLQTIVLQQRLNTLRADSEHLPELEAELAEFAVAIPATHDIARFTRQVTALADGAGISVSSISPSAPLELTPPADPAPAPESTDADAAEEPPGDSDTPVGDPAAPQAGPAGRLYTIAVTVITEGSLEGQRTFLSGLERDGERRSLVTATALAPAVEGDGADEPNPESNPWTMTTSLQIFVAPQEASESLDAAQNTN